MKHSQIVLVDDLDGTEGVETVSFAYRGKEYEIDLSEDNAAKFDKAVARYVEKARRLKPSRAVRPRP